MTVSEPQADPAAERPAPGLLEAAVLRTLAYADVFDFALREPELHRYLEGVVATPAGIGSALAGLGDRVVRRDGMVALAGRAPLLALRQERRALAARTWPVALRYARVVGSLPFVRMVAVTGALAVGNATEGADIDLFVVAAAGRVWSARAGTILVVRQAARDGLELCPNYFLAEHLLADEARDLYTARELTQMVPVTGLDVYRRLRAANAWADERLPNATGAPFGGRALRGVVLRGARPAAEAALRLPLGTLAEAWEQRRKIPRLTAHAAARGATGETGFSPDRCKGHLHGHGSRIRTAYEARLRALGLDPVW